MLEGMSTKIDVYTWYSPTLTGKGEVQIPQEECLGEVQLRSASRSRVWNMNFHVLMTRKEEHNGRKWRYTYVALCASRWLFPVKERTVSFPSWLRTGLTQAIITTPHRPSMCSSCHIICAGSWQDGCEPVKTCQTENGKRMNAMKGAQQYNSVRNQCFEYETQNESLLKMRKRNRDYAGIPESNKYENWSCYMLKTRETGW